MGPCPRDKVWSPFEENEALLDLINQQMVYRLVTAGLNLNCGRGSGSGGLSEPLPPKFRATLRKVKHFKLIIQRIERIVWLR